MEKTAYDDCRYSNVVVIVFGILGNILVIISILRQKKVLKNNYHFYCSTSCNMWSGGTDRLSYQTCELVFGRRTALYLFHEVVCFPLQNLLFKNARIGIMLIISLLRYRATVHPLKPAISRRKLKVVCGLVYIVGFIAGYGTYLPLCFRMQWNDVAIVYDKVLRGYVILCFYFFPTVFMGVVYYKIGRKLIKQYRYMKNVCSNPGKRSAPGSSFSILKFIRNRRTFLVCLITVLCYTIGNIPKTVHLILYIAEEDHLLMKYFWIKYLANVLKVAGSNSVNPLIYGILDKRLLTFCKICRKKK